jgi:hypothetical protein
MSYLGGGRQGFQGHFKIKRRPEIKGMFHERFKRSRKGQEHSQN